jgi:hypothetical protein
MTNVDQHRQNMEEAHRAHDALTNFYGSVNESTIKSGDAVLRACLLINGGAAVAILAFMGTVISREPTTSSKVIAQIAPNLNWFVGGVVAAVVAMGLTYVVHFLTYLRATSQKKVWEHPYIAPGEHTATWGWLKTVLHWVTILLAFLSVGFFVFGLLAMERAATSLPT